MKKSGFTLAEVLITLGIIGVVAAITMPTLIQNHRKHVVETKLKKFYSVMNQAIKMTETEYGEPSNWAKDCGNTGCTSDEIEEWFNTYIGKHLEVIKTEKIEKTNNSLLYVYLKDGTIFVIGRNLYDYEVYLNNKAVSNPKYGIDSFNFRFNPVLFSYQVPELNLYTIKPTLEPYVYEWDGTKEQLYSNEGRGCASNNHAYCTKLIQMNGWKIPNDYPLKF